jgi:hypothetical protein
VKVWERREFPVWDVKKNSEDDDGVRILFYLCKQPMHWAIFF